MSASRITQEKETVERMIRLYCRKKEGQESLCADCRSLLAYAWERLEKCPFGERKSACKRCSVHCYRSDMRERMRRIMRFSGPRLLFYHPGDVWRHWFRH